MWPAYISLILSFIHIGYPVHAATRKRKVRTHVHSELNVRDQNSRCSVYECLLTHFTIHGHLKLPADP